jgi:hypothetical protein
MVVVPEKLEDGTFYDIDALADVFGVVGKGDFAIDSLVEVELQTALNVFASVDAGE